MKLHSFVVLACVSVFLLAPTASAQWFDDFDSYNPGPLAPQGGWAEWDMSTNVNATVDTSVSFTAPHSVLIVGDDGAGNPGDDVVYNFAQLPGGTPGPGGQYAFSIETFVPGGVTGSAWVIMLNRYPVMPDWSIQVQFNASTGQLRDRQGGNGGTHYGPLAIQFDTWVTLLVSIDLTRDRVDIFYGNQILLEGATWRTTMDSQTFINALDLYGSEPGGTPPGILGMNFDNARLEKRFGEALSLDITPNPAFPGNTLNVYTHGPELANAPAALFTWEVNGLPFIKSVLFFSLDATGRRTIPGVVPPGVGGIDVGFKTLAVGSIGSVQSNTEIVLLR